jgi:fumarate reductase (CoM/CoB) subunit B
MGLRESRSRLEKVADACIECGICEGSCSLLNSLGITPGEIARQVLAGTASQQIIDLVQRCDLCGLCGQDCLVNLQPVEVIAAAREMLILSGQISLDDYQAMLTDQDWNFFSLYRDTYGVSYNDLAREHYDTLFFPGCTLASYSPELTRATYQWLESQGMLLGFSDLCCGKPLASIGLSERTAQLHHYLGEQMRRAGATKLVTACPNCYHHLKDYLPGVQVCSLYDLMRQAGIRLVGLERLSVHDSCPDRYGVSVGKDIRDLLAGFELIEMEHYGQNTLCCGSGGIVSMIDPDLCQARAERRMREWTATNAQRCVTACMACAHRLGRAAQPGQVVHCLELIFGISVDYEQIEINSKGIWECKWGEYNLYRLSQARLITETLESKRHEV